MTTESYNEENDGTEIYRPSNYYSDCLDMSLSKQERQDLRDEKCNCNCHYTWNNKPNRLTGQLPECLRCIH